VADVSDPGGPTCARSIDGVPFGLPVGQGSVPYRRGVANGRSNSLERQVTTLSAVLIAAVLAALGGLLLWWSASLAESATLAAFLGQLGGLLFATGGLAVAWELIGRRAFAREVLATAKLSSDVADSGVTRITDQYLDDVEWADLFAGARRLDIVVAYASTWRNTHWSRLQAIVAQPDSRIRVFLPDPDDPETMANLAHRFSKTPDAVRALVTEAIADFGSLARPGGGTVEVFVRAGDAVFSCYRFESRAVLTLYSHSRSRQTSVPTFVMAGGDLFRFVRGEIDAIVGQSHPASGGNR